MTDVPPPDAPRARPWAKFVWPAIIVALLGGHAALVTGAMLLSAAMIPGASTAPAGYEEALRWDTLQEERLASSRLGWTLDVSPADRYELNGERRVEFVLRDAAGDPLPGAALEVMLYHHSRPDQTARRELTPDAATPGRYAANLRLRREGTWKLRAEATRGAERFLVETDLWISRPAEASR